MCGKQLSVNTFIYLLSLNLKEQHSHSLLWPFPVAFSLPLSLSPPTHQSLCQDRTLTIEKLKP